MPIVDNDQINEKNVCLIIKGGKLTAKCLAKAMKLFLAGGKKIHKELTAVENCSGKGKQTVKELVGQGAGVTSIEISDKNIKSFESIARKYGVDFAVKKDTTEKPPKYLVFFKGRDTDAVTSAFKEYSAKHLKSKNAERPSVLETIRNLMEKVKNQVLDQTKHKSRGVEL